MKFSGRLQIEADPRNWVKTDLNLSQGRLELVSGGDVLGSWSTTQVKAERVEGDKFQLHLGDDRAIFAADDALAFSYDALPVLAKKSVLAVAGGLRGKLRKGLAASERAAHEPDVEPAATSDAGPFFVETQDVEADVAPPARKLRDLIHAVAAPEPAATSDADPDVVETQDVGAAEEPPTRKLRDLIQAAVRDGAAASASAGGGDRGQTATKPAEPIADPVEADEDLVVFKDPSDREVFVEVVADESPISEEDLGPVADEPEIPADTPTDRPAFDLSPTFPERPSSRNPIAKERSSGILSETVARFEAGESLGDRRVGQFGWTPEAPEAASTIDAPAWDKPTADSPSSTTREVDSLNALVDQVRNAELSPAQIGAVTDLIRALADAIEDSSKV